MDAVPQPVLVIRQPMVGVIDGPLEMHDQRGRPTAQPWLSLCWRWPLATVTGVRRQSFPDRERELWTWICEESGPTAAIEALRSAASYFRIPAKRMGRKLAEVEKAVREWRQVGIQLGMIASELDRFAEAFEPSGQSHRKAVYCRSRDARRRHHRADG
jgi:hypothetical protein